MTTETVLDSTKLRELRLARGLTQQHLAQTARVSRGLITNAEAGRTALSPRVLHAIAQTLGVPIDTLFAKPERELHQLLVEQARAAMQDTVSAIVRATMRDLVAQNDSERQLLTLFRELDAATAAALLQLLRTLPPPLAKPLPNSPAEPPPGRS
jgi:transcriptional regulator with XRE-family HTH domain